MDTSTLAQCLKEPTPKKCHSGAVLAPCPLLPWFSKIMGVGKETPCAVLQIWVYHNEQWMWSCGKPCISYSEPHFWTSCRAITLYRLSAYRSYAAWYHAKAMQQAAKRPMCWSGWRPGDFRGNLFSRLCISPGRQLIFVVSNFLKRPAHPLFYKFKPFPWAFFQAECLLTPRTHSSQLQ